MNARKFAFFAVFLTFFGIVSSSWATPAQVLIIRHAEKPDSGDNLSPQGVARAKAYVEYFQTNPAVLQYGTPVAIYAMQASSSDGGQDSDLSLRPVETVTPLAQALGLQVQSQFQKDDVQGLVNDILSNADYDGKMVLICWEHKVIQTIAVQFGVTPTPDAWPGSVFDQVWEIDFSGNQVSNFTEFQEHLMPWDQ
jgi:hypothetical protein